METNELSGVLTIRRQKSKGSLGTFKNVPMSVKNREVIINGGGVGTTFIMTHYVDDKSRTVRYPLNLLYKTPVERALNALVHGFPCPSYNQVELMRERIEEALGEPVTWIYNNPKVGLSESAILGMRVKNLPQDLLDVLGYYISTLLLIEDQAAVPSNIAFYPMYISIIEQITTICELVGADPKPMVDLFESEFLPL